MLISPMFTKCGSGFLLKDLLLIHAIASPLLPIATEQTSGQLVNVEDMQNIFGFNTVIYRIVVKAGLIGMQENILILVLASALLLEILEQIHMRFLFTQQSLIILQSIISAIMVAVAVIILHKHAVQAMIAAIMVILAVDILAILASIIIVADGIMDGILFY